MQKLTSATDTHGSGAGEGAGLSFDRPLHADAGFHVAGMVFH
jgi:hypothetical protein